MTILIVDDNEQNLYQLQVLLGSNEYQVVTAVNGAEALTTARQNPPDLIISDILMPLMDGFALCHEWKKDERLRQIPFVFYTATYTDERDREFALSLGAQQFIVKPEEPEIFIRTIREVIQRFQRPPAPPAPPAANTPAHLPGEESPKGESGYLRQYNEVLIHKLEAKMQQLEQANRALECDIAERKRAEEDLLFKTALLEAESETSIDGILVVDRSGQILLANRNFAQMWNIPESIIGAKDDKKVIEMGLPQLKYADSFLERVNYLYNHETEKSRDEVEFKDGRVFDRYSSPLQDSTGKLYGRIWYFRDITERKQADEALRQSEERFREIAETIDEVFWITIPNVSKILYVSPAYERVWGRSAASLYESPKPLIESIHSGDREHVLAVLETQETGLPFDHEYRIVRPDGAVRWIWDRGFSVRDADGRVIRYVGVAVDVTERKALEAQLQQAAKMEAVGQLAGGVAHDFNNLLTVINGYTEILMEELAADAQASIYLKEIGIAGEHAASLTRQLLAFSRRQVLAPQVLDLNAVVSNLEKMLRRLIGEDIKLHTLLNPSLGRVKADPGQIEQVIINLAVNARDAMPVGGDLTIETSNVELDEDYARNHPSVKPGPYVMLGVSDTGVGMTPETKARLFEPFFTTKEMGKGTGLGLATVYGIVKQSGGSIWVYSELGHGTVFKVYLPVVRESLSARGAAEVEIGSARGTETILVVEDEEAVRSLIRLALVSGGYKVLETRDPESALAICASHDGPIHLLLTDVVMPQMSGPVMARKVAALCPAIRVLYMSGYTDDAIVHHGVLSQEMPFIQKPFSPVVLRKKIREVLGGNKG